MANYILSGIDFSSIDQSIYRSNSQGGISAVFEPNPATWSETLSPPINAFVGEVQITPPLKIFGKTIIPAIKFAVNTGFDLNFSTNGSLGFRAGVELSGGSIDTDLTYGVDAQFTNGFRGTTGVSTDFVGNISGSISKGSFVTLPPGAFAFAEVPYSVDVDLGIKAQLFGQNILPSFLGNVKLDEEGTYNVARASLGTIGLIEVPISNSDGINFIINLDLLNTTYAVETDVVSGKLSLTIDDEAVGVRGTPVFASDLAELAIKIPDTRGIGTYESGNVIDAISEVSGDGQIIDPIARLSLDLDGIASFLLNSLLPLPVPLVTGVGVNLGGFLDIDFDLLDIDAGPELRFVQDFQLAPNDLMVELAFADENGIAIDSDTLGISDATPDNLTWTGRWADFPNLTLTQPTVVTPTFSVAPTLTNTSSLDLGAFLELAVLQLGYSVKVPKKVPIFGGNTIASGQIGPAFWELLRESDLGLPALSFPFNIQSPINLGGFNTVAGAPIVFDVVGSGKGPGFSGVNDGVNTNAPVGVEDRLEVNEGDTRIIQAATLLGNDYDSDAFDTLSITAASGATNGTVRLRPDGSIVYVPTVSLTSAETSSDSFTYTITDAVGNTGTGTVTVAIQGVNGAPVGVDDAYQTAAGGSIPSPRITNFGSLVANDQDEDGDVLSAVAETKTTALGAEVIISADGTFTYNDRSDTNANFTGIMTGDTLYDSFTYTVVDPDGATSVATANVVILGSDDGSDQDPFGFNVSETTLNLVEGGAPGQFIVSLRQAPPEPGAVFSVTTDDTTEISIVPITNDLSFDPFTPFAPNQIVFELDDWFVPRLITINPLDDGITDGTQTVNLTVGFSEALNEIGFDEYFALSDQTITVNVSDQAGGVTGIPGIVVDKTALTVTEGGNAQTLNVSLAARPATNVIIDIANSNAAEATLSTTQLTFTPSNWATPQAVTVTAVDDSVVDGAQLADLTLSISNGSDPLFTNVSPVAVEVTVADNENQTPIGRLDSATTAEDTAVTITVVTNDIDPEGQALTVDSATAQNGSVIVNPNNTLTYTPNANFNGADIINYVISDPQGATATVPVTLTVTPVNDGPVISSDIAATEEDTPVTINVLGNDSDVDGDTLTITGVSNVTNGTAQIVNNRIVFTPDADFVNADIIVQNNEQLFVLKQGSAPATFTYEISDGNGGTASAMGVVYVTATNDAPTAGTDTFTVAEDVDLEITVAQLLANDSDPDLAPGASLRFINARSNVLAALGPDGLPVGPPTNSKGYAFEENGELVTYEQLGAFNRLGVGETDTDSFTYVIEDDLGKSAIGTVNITITGVNDAPDVVDDIFQATIPSGSTSPIQFSSLLTNDTDPESDPLTARIVPNAQNENRSERGVPITVATDGTFTYDFNGFVNPAPGEVIVDMFQYAASDGNGGETIGNAAVAIVGEGGGPGFALSSAEETIQEAKTYSYFLVTLTQKPTTNVSLTVTSNDTTEVQFGLDDDPTTDNIDESEVPVQQTTLLFTPDTWDTPQVVGLIALDDGIVDGDQPTSVTVSVDQTSDANFTGLSSQDVSVTVLDKEIVPEILISKNVLSVAEGGNSDSFDVTLAQAPTSDVVLSIQTTDPADTTISATSLTFTPQNYNQAQTITVTAIDDIEYEEIEFAVVTLDVAVDQSAAEYATAPQNFAVIGIQDDDVFTEPSIHGKAFFIVSQNADQVEGNGGSTAFTFEVSRTNPEGVATVDYSIAGSGSNAADASDFDPTTMLNGTVSFADGELRKTLSVLVNGDMTLEEDEEFTVSLSNPDNGRLPPQDGRVSPPEATATATIRNDDTSSKNIITGTENSDFLQGTDGMDRISGLGGSYDRLLGGLGADEFVFGAETSNGRRERDVILDFEIGVDTIVLEQGATVSSIRETSGPVVVFLQGDRDAIYVNGDGVTADNIVNDILTF